MNRMLGFDCGEGGCCACAICMGADAARVAAASKTLRRLSELVVGLTLVTCRSLSQSMSSSPSAARPGSPACAICAGPLCGHRHDHCRCGVASNRIFSIVPVNGNEPFAL